MTITISIDSDLKDLAKDLPQALKNQIPFVLSKTMNEALYHSSTHARKQFPRYLENPTPFTRRGVQYDKTTKRNLLGSVFIPHDQWKYLRYVIVGGVKRWTRSTTGIIIPTKAMKLNQYGNIPGKGQRSDLWRYGHASRAGEFVVLPKDAAKRKMKAGVYERGHASKTGKFSKSTKSKSSNVRMIAMFRESVRYNHPFNFDKIVITQFKKKFGERLYKNFFQVMRNELSRRR